MHQDSPALELILSDMNSLIRRAFAEGHRIGLQEAHDRMTRALTGGPHIPSQDVPRSPQMSVNASHSPFVGRGAYVPQDRRIGYGTVITNFRRAIVSAPDIGLTRDQLIEFSFQNGVEVTVDQFKDTMKRLVNGKEVKRIHLAYYIGPKMRFDLIPSDTPGLDAALAQEQADVETKQSQDSDQAEELFS